tara:strand:- start:2244 stop:3380 length:1137 start_codon:yes stop_codon:yes gene_type:complete
LNSGGAAVADDRYYSNTDEAQRFQPGTTAEAGQVDQKFDEVTAGFQEVAQDTDRSLKLPAVTGTSQELNATPLQRRRMVVGFDADGNLTLLQGFGWRGDWATATEYFVNDVFRDPVTKNLYVTVTRHTSAAALSTDITAERVELAISVEEIEAAKTAAQTAASTATAKAGEAASSASTAAAKASEASASAGTATTKAGEASSSAAAAAEIYDNFDDRYLGAKTSDPDTDNDGDPLLVGALYFNSTSSSMRQWSGSAWGDSYATVDLEGDASGAINMAGNALNIRWSTKTAAYAAIKGDRLLANTSAGAFTITLPSTPSSGDEVWFADPGANWATNNLTVDGNGNNIDGAATFSADLNEGYFAAIYNGAAWVIKFAGGV